MRKISPEFLENNKFINFTIILFFSFFNILMSKLTLNAGAEEALLAAKWGDARKKVNAESWTFTLEKLLAGWGEKAAGLRWMHAKSGENGNHFLIN